MRLKCIGGSANGTYHDLSKGAKYVVVQNYEPENTIFWPPKEDQYSVSINVTYYTPRIFKYNLGTKVFEFHCLAPREMDDLAVLKFALEGR